MTILSICGGGKISAVISKKDCLVTLPFRHWAEYLPIFDQNPAGRINQCFDLRNFEGYVCDSQSNWISPAALPKVISDNFPHFNAPFEGVE